MGTCTSSTNAVVQSESARPDSVPGDNTSCDHNKACSHDDNIPCARCTIPPNSSPSHIARQHTYSVATDFSDRYRSTESEKGTGPACDSMMSAILELGYSNLCENVELSPESNFIVEDDQYSRDRDNEVVTVVSNNSKSLISFSKVTFSVSDITPNKSIDERCSNEDYSHPISNISSLTSASPVPSPMNSLSFTEGDHDDCIVIARQDKLHDLRKTRSLFGHSFNSLASQLTPITTSRKILPMGEDAHDEMDDYIDW